LATELQLRYGRFAQILSKYGFEDVNSDFVLTAENAALIVEEAGFIAVTESKEADEDLYAAALPEDMSVFPQRPPVVTIMGHVDHGKTTILDHMRKSSIVASEHGGITQHIGAFSVPMPSGKTITFLDTPGHAAFLSMRQRGANVTDIVILVVAADDSVMPQTLEALKHAKAAQVPIIVAMNKIDKPEAKPDQVKQDLARHGVDIEDYGGDVQVVLVSGKTGQGMQDLEEAIVALSEIQDQRAPVDGNVEGWVLESSTKEVGKVATVLVRRGTLHAGDIVVAGTEYCRVRSMRDEFGNQVSEVGPGMPAEIDGWRGQPNAGDEVLQAPNEQVAGNVTSLREAKLKRVDLAKDVEVINEQRKARQIEHEREKAIERARKEGVELPDDVAETATDNGTGIKNVYLIIKGDVAGSVEAVVNSIAPLGNSEVRPIILKAAVGTVSESDVDHATASGGQVISFNTTISPNIRALAERAGTKILDHNIIYRLVDDVKASLEAELTPIVKSRVLGEAEIAQIFEINQKRKKVKIAGCKVRNGTVVRNSKVRVLRGLENEVVYAGKFRHHRCDYAEVLMAFI
jgi:translation initiation factor IF-2